MKERRTRESERKRGGRGRGRQKERKTHAVCSFFAWPLAFNEHP